MSFNSQSTPERLMPRADSKNPATTCKGITSNGRPCRRSLGSLSRVSAPSSQRLNSGVVAVVPNVTDNKESAAAFYCWQHKAQATALTSAGGGETEIVNLQTRSSTDSLIDRLGVLTIDDATSARGKARRGKNDAKFLRRDTLPGTWRRVPGPLMSLNEDTKAECIDNHSTYPRERRRRRSSLYISFFCCTAAEFDTEPSPGPRPATAPKPSAPKTSQTQALSQGVTDPPKATQSAPNGTQKQEHKASSAYTEALLSFIPTSIDLATTQLLLAELSKPLTQADLEPGYIYIFWLTPPSSGPQPGKADVKLLLASGSSQHTTELLRKFSIRATASSTRRIMLKIGRASNVHRRMHQWAQQCGYDISLLRWYPYHDKDKSTAPRMVPLAPRVERLIHVELAAQRCVRNCDGCGRGHREWFEVEATREGIKKVDGIVRRWVNYALEEGGA